MTRVVMSLGSNLGDRRANLAEAVRRIGPDRVSHIYETPPWGDPDQPTYYNITLIAHDPGNDPDDWLALAADCERRAGRVRDPGRRYGPRVLDVDLVTVFDADGRPIVRTDPSLTLPHPRAHQRAFVLVPWLAIEPDAVLPGRGRVRDLLRGADLAADARMLRKLTQISSTDDG